MPIYGFESQDDFNRARDVIRTVEGQRVDLTRTKRARYPSVGSGGGGARPYVITATSGQETISAFTRADVIVGAKKARYENGVVEADPDADEQEIELFALGGVLFTGDVCFVSKTLGVDAWSGGTSAHTFMGKAVESMSAGEEGKSCGDKYVGLRN